MKNGEKTPVNNKISKLKQQTHTQLKREVSRTTKTDQAKQSNDISCM